MANQYAAGKKALGICDRCGFQFKLKELRELVINESKSGLRVCKECWEPDQPQNRLGKYVVQDPQALRNPRPDTYDGNRNTQYGWRPVGFRDPYGLNYSNNLEGATNLGTVTVTTT